MTFSTCPLGFYVRDDACSIPRQLTDTLRIEEQTLIVGPHRIQAAAGSRGAGCRSRRHDLTASMIYLHARDQQPFPARRPVCGSVLFETRAL